MQPCQSQRVKECVQPACVCSRCDGVAFSGNRLAQERTRLVRLHVYLVGCAVYADLGLGVNVLYSARDGFFAVAASHAGDGKGLDQLKYS